jgi:cytoskeleton protein RodZ
MTSDPIFQDSLFADPLGLRFRHMREKARWSVESVAQQLKLPASVITAIEREDWARLGAPIYIRSYVGSYARLLGLPPEIAEDIIRDKPTPQLVATGSESGARRVVDRSLRNIAYMVMTVVIVGSVVMLVMHFQAPSNMAQVLPLDPPVANAPAARTGAIAATSAPIIPSSSVVATTTPATTNGGVIPPVPADAGAQAPVMASLAPSMPAAGVSGNDLVLRFRDQSWLEALDASGQKIERDLVDAGSERHFSAGQVAHITLGNAQAVDISQGGRPLNLAPFRDGNVARFSVSRDGSITPPGE